MEHWQLFIITGIVFVIVEMLTPVMFFLNLALACFVTAVFALFMVDWNILIPIFVCFSALFLMFLRPILTKIRVTEEKTGVEEKYIGKIAKVLEPVTLTKGVVSIYDERWTARSVSGEQIEVGAEVKIIKNESLLLYVEKVNS
jgi:inner membrane protein